jgi:GNAT superfamily N-acetyltransferase
MARSIINPDASARTRQILAEMGVANRAAAEQRAAKLALAAQERAPHAEVTESWNKNIPSGQLNALFASVGWEEREPAKWQEVLAKSSEVLSYWQDDRLVAFARMIDDGINCTFHDGVVSPDHQGAGLMHRMMGRAFETVQDRGFGNVSLVAAPGTAEMYKSMGWESDSTVMRLRTQ